MSTVVHWHKIAILGVGLIGGSLALALRRAGAVDVIHGYGRNVANLDVALARGVLDSASRDLAMVVEGADLIVLAVPMGEMPALLTSLAQQAPPEAIITDVGSVKGWLCDVATQTLGAGVTRFVPGHPIAGTEKSGVQAAFPELFDAHHVILTPLDTTESAAVTQVQAMWQACGASVAQLNPSLHDEIMAACSHLPHMLAYVLVDMLARRADHQQVFDFAAGGFRDFTRIASSHPQMWRDISITNQQAILQLLRDYQGDLAQLIAAIEAGDSERLLQIFSRAKAARDTYLVKASDDTAQE